MPTIEPYTISVPESHIQRLKQKLELTTFPDEIDGAAWDYGVPLAEIKRISAYWKDKYDWRKAEAALNELPNYKTTIHYDAGFDPLDIHFIHQKSEVKNAIPLCFVHGWPGSFLEVSKILRVLADSEKDGGPAFHIVAPSLPNFGFSDGVKKRGFGGKQYAETCHKVMLSLGYDQYVTQGGDWGFGITRIMAKLYQSHVKASHINMVASMPPKPSSPFGFIKFLTQYALNWFTPEEKAGLERTKWYQKVSQGYYHLQTTKPQTIGYSLADSPVGLLAWIYEKLREWTDGYPWTDEEICTWMSVYWFSTAGPAASVNIYYESVNTELPILATGMTYIPVILGLSWFPKELAILPESWAPTLGPIVFKKRHDRGGHFAAWEVPESLAGDLRIMFGKGGGAFGAVEGKSGYE